MKVYDTEAIRNVAFVGHGDSGKTSLVSALLYAAGATEKLGSVPEGTAPTDFDPEEVERKVSMAVAVAWADWKDRKLNLVDAPGYTNFIGEAAAALRAADSALIVVHALDGIGVQTEKMWEDSEKQSKPVLFAINQLDRDRADFDQLVSVLQERFGRQVMPISFPVMEGGQLVGVVDLVSGKARRPKGDGKDVEEFDPPGDLADRIAAAREQLVDMVAESDEELMEAYLEAGELTAEQLEKGLRTAIASRAIFPVFATAATAMVGIHSLLDGLAGYAPSPADMPPVVAKTPDGEEKELPADPAGPLVLQVFKTYIDPFAGRITLFRVFSGTLKADQSAWNVRSETQEKMAGLSAPKGKGGDKVSEVKAGDIAFVTKHPGR